MSAESKAEKLPIVVTIVMEDGRPFSRYYPDYNDLTSRRNCAKFVTSAIVERRKVITAPYDETNNIHQRLRLKFEAWLCNSQPK